MLALSFLAALSTPAAYVSKAPVAYMVDMASGTPLYARNADRKIPTASMAKMMSAWVVFEAMKAGKLQPQQTYVVSDASWKAWNNKGSTMFLKAREKVSVDQLLHGMLTVSGNDASVVLAEGVAGSEAAFVVRMNQEAKRLGMKSSRFGTANGWPDEGRTYSTAHDLAILAERIVTDHPELFRRYFGKREFSWNNVVQPNRNPLLGAVAGADGLKTGHSDEAGYCLAGTAERNGRRIIMVIAGLNSQQDRISEARTFMNWGFAAWTSRPLFKRGAKVAQIPVQLGTSTTIDLLAPRALAAVLPATGGKNVKLAVRYKGPVRAPFGKGTKLAELVATLPDGSKQVMPLVAARDVETATFLGRAWNGVRSLVGA